MSEREPLELEADFGFDPTLLIQASKRMPLTPDGYVPLGLDDVDFKIQRPVISDLGMGAVSLSFNKPFGFLDRSDNPEGFVKSQLTDGIVLAPSDNKPNKWQAILNTNAPLTTEDAMLFNRGVNFYTFSAKLKLDSQPRWRIFWSKLFGRRSRN